MDWPANPLAAGPLTRPESAQQSLRIFALACVGAAGIGVVDFVTGAGIVVTPLYFLPLALAGVRLRRPAAMVVVVTTGARRAALHLDHGADFQRAYVWVVDFTTQGSAFLVVTLLVSHLSEQLTHEQVLRRRDALTRRLKRQGFIEQAGSLLSLCRRNGRPMPLAHIDLDDFEGANDRFGHDHGDRLLKTFGEIVAASVRTSDLAARMGGDEFVILLPETGHDAALEVCERIVQALPASHRFRSSAVFAGIGVVVDDGARSDIDGLLGRADAQTYGARARQKGVGFGRRGVAPAARRHRCKRPLGARAAARGSRPGSTQRSNQGDPSP